MQTENPDTVLELSHVSKFFGGNVALDDVSYQVKKGSVFALLGENGAGKTTTIRILLGLCEPDSGRSRVLGMDSRRDHLEIRRSVGYVPEQPILYDWMTVEEIGRFTAFRSPLERPCIELLLGMYPCRRRKQCHQCKKREYAFRKSRHREKVILSSTSRSEPSK